MIVKFIKYINVIVLASIFLSMESPSNQSLPVGNLFHDGVAYYTEVFTRPYALTVFRDARLVEIAGIRIYHIFVDGLMSSGFIRTIFKTNYSLRAGAKYQDVILADLVFK
ncbi:hypothetical protein, partial [Candidatus Similichlamydia epinepheli]|uniref:hypothetical protein n=1 Tax=Candidatus Similichlamydia epinepheli TaxID=1903953 RepID=UPI001959072B